MTSDSRSAQTHGVYQDVESPVEAVRGSVASPQHFAARLSYSPLTNCGDRRGANVAQTSQAGVQAADRGSPTPRTLPRGAFS